MFKLSEFLTKLDAAYTLIPFIMCAIYLFKSRNSLQSVSIFIFSIFIVFITAAQIIISVLAYSKSQNLYLLKFFIPTEAFLLFTFGLQFQIVSIKKVIIVSLLLALTCLLYAIIIIENGMPYYAFVFQYFLASILFIYCSYLRLPTKNDRLILYSLLIYSIAGFTFAGISRFAPTEAFIVFSILSIGSKFLFSYIFYKIMEALWN